MMQSEWVHFFAQIAISIPAFLIAISFHEFCHAWAARLMGDNTAYLEGRLTLNPLAHLDFMGLAFLMIFGIGWANPVPFDQRNFKYPRLFSVITALVGPLANFFMAILAFVFIKHLPPAWFAPAVYLTFIQILQAVAWVNVMLGVFNILPLPPLDGSHILIVLLIDRYPSFVAALYRYSFFILLLIFLLPPARAMLGQMVVAMEYFLRSLVF